MLYLGPLLKITENDGKRIKRNRSQIRIPSFMCCGLSTQSLQDIQLCIKYIAQKNFRLRRMVVVILVRLTRGHSKRKVSGGKGVSPIQIYLILLTSRCKRKINEKRLTRFSKVQHIQVDFRSLSDKLLLLFVLIKKFFQYRHGLGKVGGW